MPVLERKMSLTHPFNLIVIVSYGRLIVRSVMYCNVELSIFQCYRLILREVTQHSYPPEWLEDMVLRDGPAWGGDNPKVTP